MHACLCSCLLDTLASLYMSDIIRHRERDCVVLLPSDCAAAAVVNRIMDAPDLEELCLSGNTIGAEAAKAIAGALAQRPSFKVSLLGHSHW